jgi:hypothetical protein
MKHDPITMRPASVEELLWSWPTVCRCLPDGWAKDFALSIQKQSKWKKWKPTEKQLGIMRRMVSELYQTRGAYDADPDLIED